MNNQIERWKQKKNNPSNSSAYIRAKKDYDERRVLYKNNYEAYQQGKIYSKPSYDGVKKARNRMVQAKANWEKSCDEKIKPLEEQLSKKNKELERVQEQLKLSRTAKNKASDRRDKLADRRLEKENAKQEQIDNGNHFIRNFEILDWAVLPSNNNGKWMDFIFLWMIRLLFFIIEILPTVVKIVTPVGAYDWMVHREEDDIKDYINSTEYSDSLKKMHEIELQAKEELLQQQHEAEKELKRMILDKMREAQFKVANAAITKWESDQILKISGSPNKEDISDTGTL